MSTRISTSTLLWGFTWRMSSLGFAFVTAIGAIYGVLLVSTLTALASTSLLLDPGVNGPLASLGGTATVLVIAVVVIVPLAAILGALAAAPLGLILGVLNGLLVFALTSALCHPLTAGERTYRKVAWLSCSVASILAMLVDWVLHDGFPSPILSAPWRTYHVILMAGRSEEPGWRIVIEDNSWAGSLLTVVILAGIPMLAATVAMGLSGWLVSGWYTRLVQQEKTI